MNTALLNSIVGSEALPSMPVVAFKVLELCREDDVELDDVAVVIEKDPALTAKILKLANSSMFGMSKKVAAIDQAMVVLGLRTVKIMSLGFSLVDAFKQDTGSGFDYPAYWRRCMSTAVAARQIADCAGEVRRDEAFVGGLLCDIGMMAAERHPDRIYQPVIVAHNERKGSVHLIEAEQLGITHAQISAMMLAKWSMPELMCHSVQAHHGVGYEQLEGRTKLLAGILWAASQISELFCGDCDAAEYDAVREQILSIVNLTESALDEIMEMLNTQVNQTAELFSIEMNAAISFEEIRMGAMMQIANLSLSAEQDRATAESRADQADNQVQTLSALTESLRSRAEIDKLTGIANRQSFDDRLASTIQNATEQRADVGLLMLDVDHFKKFNDTYGHLIGDEVLSELGKCLSEMTCGPQFSARYGGEEFAVIAVEVTARELRALAEEVRKSIARLRILHGNKELNITASVGAAHVSFGEEQVSATELIRRADGCLYDAKREGRNRVEMTF